MRQWLKYPILLLAVALVLFSGATAPSISPPVVSALVSFEEPPGPDEEELIESLGGVITYRYEVVPAVAALMPVDSLDVLRENPRVTWVEEDSRAWASGEVVPWELIQTDAGLARSRDEGYAVRVAILDSGIDLDRPDLAVAGDVTFVDGTTSGDDDNGHGTMVASVVAALINGVEVGESAPEIELYAVKVMDRHGWVRWSNVIKGIDWAWKNDMDVVNMSFGGPNEPPKTVHNAVRRAHRKGVLLVAGAGNRGDLGLEDSVYYPAHYDEVIAVGATDEMDTRVSNSSTGPSLELVAPGASIYTTTIGGYGTGGGTSLSTPHVVGAAALVIASGITDPAQVRQRLQETADDLGPAGWDQEYGYGLVDAYEAATP
jgi:subtilisin